MNPQEKSIVIVIFAGLMFFHNYERDHYFKVGILKGAHNHRLEIVGPSKQRIVGLPSNASGVSAGKKSRRTTHVAYPDEMTLEITNQLGGSLAANATALMNPKFDRLASGANEEDYQYVADFDQLHPQGYSIARGALGPNIYLRAGELRTACRTDFLKSKQGGTTTQDYGFMADKLALYVELNPNQTLVLTGTTLRVEYQLGTRYVLISNVPPEGMRCPNDIHCRNFDTHFQYYYYSAVPMPGTERFDFGFRDPKPKLCDFLTKDAQSFLAETLKMTPPPFFCGIAATSRDWSLSETVTKQHKKVTKQHKKVTKKPRAK